ncbi:MAG: hypothetical protein J6X45_07770, partial [Lachnospiraceae bacterium]|nr:hypothetical protein [Lachnospiraceae bacterium]
IRSLTPTIEGSFNSLEIIAVCDSSEPFSDMTDPGWVFLLTSAKGVISEKGSLLSHTAIISRELKLPSIVGVKDLMLTIRSGDVIRMNGDNGKIKIIKRGLE